MDNLQLHPLSFNRLWATFDNFLPEPVLDELLVMLKTNSIVEHAQEFRNSITRVENTVTDKFFVDQVPKLIYEWTGKHTALKDWQIWIDNPGLTYAPHTDIGRLKRLQEHHIQVYLNNGPSELGTRIHNWYRKQIGQAQYKLNTGIYLNTAQTIKHSVSRVPVGYVRTSVRARYV